ncbi:hypothetical protein NX794_05550 [Streptomyces sp. LP11]|uniref:Uncharacterized protein n=1 Tax=Streptomyces pyxinicus TaxID=2970331 RepID=A0ABT2AWR7_9ACTN|nr:hypothetical protein [Streptomyces sp. LP11]MCS0600698.1 hypothetical protein [Streptomyces sp. LP11]
MPPLSPLGSTVAAPRPDRGGSPGPTAPAEPARPGPGSRAPVRPAPALSARTVRLALCLAPALLAAGWAVTHRAVLDEGVRRLVAADPRRLPACTV